MLATMRANERLLEGRSNRAIFALNAQIRIFAVGMLPVAVAIRLGEPLTVALYIAGFFTPLALYALGEGCGLALSLAELGMPRTGIESVLAEVVESAPKDNPRSVDAAAASARCATCGSR